jgi:hypothetical protein
MTEDEQKMLYELYHKHGLSGTCEYEPSAMAALEELLSLVRERAAKEMECGLPNGSHIRGMPRDLCDACCSADEIRNLDFSKE